MKLNDWISGYEDVERQLDNWAQWNRSGAAHNLGYPKKSLCISSGGQSVSGVFEEICDEVDRAAAEIMECLVYDLPLNQRGAILRRWLGCKIIVRNAEESLMQAYDSLCEGMSKRGLT